MTKGTKKEKIGRREIAKRLTQAAVNYVVPKLYSCHLEFGIQKWGRARLDMLAFNMKTDFVGFEIKSCAADYRTDSKWRQYVPYVNKFYFVIPEKLWNNEKFRSVISSDCNDMKVGILVLSETSGKLRSVRKATRREVDQEFKLKVITKMAWRGGVSRRTHKRCNRVYLEE